MSAWKAKRFWTDVTTRRQERGFSIGLDHRSVLTPARAPMIVPTQLLADLIAAEWADQGENIDPSSMPLTRCANAAIDKVAPQRRDVANNLAAYGDADLLCYRAETPAGLVARQSAAWDPLLDWADATLHVRLAPRTGVVHAAQEPGALARLSKLVHALTDFEIAAFQELVGLSGSLVIGFAVARDARPVTVLWAASRIDEVWQQDQWGEDSEATEQERRKRRAFLDAADFLRACRQ